MQKRAAKDFYILIVDDDVFNAMIIEKFLIKDFPNIDIVYDSTAAIKILEEKKIDLILTDIHIHGSKLDGVDLMKAAKDRHPQLKAVALTGSALEGDREKYITEGFDEYMRKPFERSQLSDLVESYL